MFVIEKLHQFGIIWHQQTQIDSDISDILKVFFLLRLLHLWVKACVGLTMPLHLDTSLKEVPISLTYTPDIAQAWPK